MSNTPKTIFAQNYAMGLPEDKSWNSHDDIGGIEYTRKDVADAQLKVKEARIATLEAELLKYHEEIGWLYDEVQFLRDTAARTRNNSANEDIDGEKT
tara:strand:+ start:3141 stop:3431 length:291 start_codon:yes stop_codon:yes gene_type:complete